MIENDWLDAIVQLPTDMFYNTGITTYIWIVTKDKAEHRAGKVQLIDASKMFVKRRKNLGNKRNELTKYCIDAIVKAYKEFDNKLYEIDEKSVESKIYDNDDFKYLKVVVETPIKDEKGNIVLDKKGRVQPDASLRDTEIIPFKEDVKDFMAKNVYPYNPDAFIDEKKMKEGYEIPFTRIFYKFVEPTPLQEIFSNLKEMEKEETVLMKELFNND